MDQIVQNVIRKTNTDSDEFEELDLSELSSIDAQIEFLKRQDRVDTYIYYLSPGWKIVERWNQNGLFCEPIYFHKLFYILKFRITSQDDGIFSLGRGDRKAICKRKRMPSFYFRCRNNSIKII